MNGQSDHHDLARVPPSDLAPSYAPDGGLSDDLRAAPAEGLPPRTFSPWRLLEYKWSILAAFIPLTLLGVGIVAAVMVRNNK